VNCVIVRKNMGPEGLNKKTSKFGLNVILILSFILLSYSEYDLACCETYTLFPLSRASMSNNIKHKYADIAPSPV
jgi:hypothetical protein